MLGRFWKGEKGDENPKASYALLIESAEDKLLLLEQYKILLDTLEKANELRETINKFWVSVNGAIIAYITDSEKMGHQQKPFFLTTILFFGFILTASWFSTIFSIKNNESFHLKIDMKAF